MPITHTHTRSLSLHQKQCVSMMTAAASITHADLLVYYTNQVKVKITNNCVIIKVGGLRVLFIQLLMVQFCFPHFNPVLMDAWCFARKFPMNHKIAASIFYTLYSYFHALETVLFYAHEVQSNMV